MSSEVDKLLFVGIAEIEFGAGFEKAGCFNSTVGSRWPLGRYGLLTLVDEPCLHPQY